MVSAWIECWIVGPPYCFVVTSMGQGYMGEKKIRHYFYYLSFSEFFDYYTESVISDLFSLVTFLAISVSKQNRYLAVLLLCILECEKGPSLTRLLEELDKLCLYSSTA